MRTITKRHGAIALTLAACLPMLLSCNENPIDMPSEEGQFTICFGTDRFETRSAVGTASQLDGFESAYKDVTIFQFLVDGDDNATLTNTYYQALNGNQTVTASGEVGKTYRFYALLNSGDHTSELSIGDSEDNLSNISVSWPLSSRNLSDGIPAASDGVEQTLAASGTSFTIPCTRLASCWDFKIATGDMSHGSFTVTSLQLCQSPIRCSPFIAFNNFASSESSSVANGDYASASDLSSLNSGNAVRFYTLENVCGTLLSNSTMDPWLKVPDSGNGVSDYLPTYIEVKGTYTDGSGNLSSENTYRMYLGENNYDNFNVLRGTNYTLTLNLTEDPIIAGFSKSGNWKVETGVTDNRNFQFSPDYHQFKTGGSCTVTVTGDDPSYGIYYTLVPDKVVGVSLDRVSFDEETMTITANLLDTDRSWMGLIHLQAWYWDGVLADDYRIILTPQGSSAITPDPVEPDPDTGEAVNPYGNPIGIVGGHSGYGGVFNYALGHKHYLIHNPDCNEVHKLIHYDKYCKYNHTKPKKSNYIPIEECPLSHYDYDDCLNKIEHIDYTYLNFSKWAFYLCGNYYVDDDGELCSEQLGYDTDFTLVNAYFINYDDMTQTSGGILENSTSVTGDKCWFELYNIPNITDKKYLKIDVRLTETTAAENVNFKNYIVPRMNVGLVEDADYPIFNYTANIASIQISPTTPDSQTVTPTCSKDYIRTWIISRDGVKFVNNDGRSLNSFKKGDTMTLTVDRSKCNEVENIYLLDGTGHIVGTSTINFSNY